MHESRSLSDFKSAALTLEITGNVLSHTHAHELQTVTEIRLGDNSCVCPALWLKCAKIFA